MLSCIVSGCKSNSASNPNVHFFNIPKESFARREWLDFLSLRNRQVNESTRVCEKHFKEKDFTYTSTGRKVLKHHAIPIFNVSGKATLSSDEDDEFMQCNSDSDPEILEVKKISKQMAVDAAAAAAGNATIKKERISPPPIIKKEPQDEEMVPLQETGRRPSRRAAQLAVKKIHNTVRSLSYTPEKAMEMMDNSSTATSSAKSSPARASPARATPPRNTAPKEVSQPRAKRRRSGKQSSPPKPKFRDQKVWHSVRAPLSNIGLLMECHEELLTPTQAEALMKAQTEYNNVMRMLRTLKANNFRIILETADKPETSAPPPPPPPQVITSPTVIKTQKPPGSFTVKQANLVQTSSSGVTVVPVHLVTVQQTKH